MIHRTSLAAGCGLAALLLLAGCASSAEPRPDRSLDVARAAITEAESAGARETAPVLLNRARNKIDGARRLMSEEEYGQARRLLERATADARLAKARANTAQAQAAVDELNETIRMLRERMLEDES
jgi:hypothetical protein